MPVIAKQSHAEEIERQKQLQQLTNQADDNINQIDKEPTEEARLTINLTNSAAAKNDEVKAHTEVSHQVDVTPRTGLITTASSGDAPLEADCHQKFPSQKGEQYSKNADIEYKDTLAQIDEMIEKYKDTHEIIVCGDMNGSLDRSSTPHDKILKTFCKEKCIGNTEKCPVKETFYHQNAGKAPDEDGISAEHYKHGMEELTPLIRHLLNLILTYLDVPIFLKTVILTPILKKEKDKTLPSSYRGITVTKTFAKILQSILKDRVDSVFNNIQNSLQRGFTEGVSSLCAAFLTSEAIEESKKLKILLILITLDAEKAFDKLNHEILFNKLYHYGIKGKLWILLRNLYKRNEH
ncbi:Hypothetical predicted protein [Mytilus galloprovincialis]|uniref:Reverse transcriptase domain-containing protein n=1 Tax=Mytilus galloprovincialis TaxID=29158 RepID=A0A8B6F0W8_MYTGA|nr:Hypothetical predicted protein [Mytilus galloprovincialis]